MDLTIWTRVTLINNANLSPPMRLNLQWSSFITSNIEDQQVKPESVESRSLLPRSISTSESSSRYSDIEKIGSNREAIAALSSLYLKIQILW